MSVNPWAVRCGVGGRWSPLLLLAAVLLPLAPANAADRLASGTLVVANDNVPDSVALAEYYMEKRGIPAGNLYKVNAPRSETIRWNQFVESIFNPLKKRLIEDRWIRGSLEDRTDPDGRFLHPVSGHRIENLVLCYGMPLRIRHDEERLPEEIRQHLPEPLQTNRGSVDSELALLPHTAYDINAFHRNPLFENRFPSSEDRSRMVRVARLDGPSLEDARNLVDTALEAEEKGLRGRAYIDLGGPHPRGDEWLERTSRRIEELGFDLSLHGQDESLDEASRFDAPALYFGWYAPHVAGPFTREGFRFPPGAVAIHIHSFSATTVRSGDERWVGPFVFRGVTATVGNVYEPYLELTHRPDHLFEALMRGHTLAEAAAYSLPALSWQPIVIGDPLFRPFLVELDDQIPAAPSAGDDGLLQYAVIRKMNLLKDEDGLAEAIEFGEGFHEASPRIPLALALARFHAENGDSDRALQRLELLDGPGEVSGSNPGLIIDIIDFMVSIGGSDRALEVSRSLIERSDLSPQVRRAVLRQGAALAEDQGERRLARRWESERRRLNDD